MLTWPERKHPDEVLDYYVDWSGALEPTDPSYTGAAEEITSCTGVVTSGTVTIVSVSVVGALLCLVLSGGTAGELTTIETTLVTSKGRTYTEVVRLRVGG